MPNLTIANVLETYQCSSGGELAKTLGTLWRLLQNSEEQCQSLSRERNKHEKKTTEMRQLMRLTETELLNWTERTRTLQELRTLKNYPEVFESSQKL